MALFWTAGYFNESLSGSTGILATDKANQLKAPGGKRGILVFSLDKSGSFVPENAQTASLVKPPLVPQNKTSAELNTLIGSYNGEIIYNITTHTLVYWQKDKWRPI